MHIIKLNICELFIPLWRGTLAKSGQDNIQKWPWAKLVGDVWIEHGLAVANATKHFPSFFHRPPRNPVEKISSGYKATEYFLYVFGLGPGLFRSILPPVYYQNFCRLVRGESEVEIAHTHLVQFVHEYEQIYYQRQVDRLHFCRPCLHTLLHASSEVYRVGPGLYMTQFFMERHLWLLGKQLRQPSNTYGNLMRQALRHCETVALGAAKETRSSPYELRCKRWGRLRLPNGQVARSLWQESRSIRHNLRVSRNVKLRVDNVIEYGEVQYYFMRTQDGGNPADIGRNTREHLKFYALVSLYSRPDNALLEESCGVLWTCRYNGHNNLIIVDVKSILSVVSVQPLPKQQDRDDGLLFIVEKTGVEEIQLVGFGDEIRNEEEDDMI
ncbi:hypothetical protein K435DRAFT_821512 [Dendrothele bispora CBS 962.96]|uniref:Uncharacterized protein n=1 Tax=Dendrothele bispora (strain CBS 962.96) TaxID=1314807 RepID=A0A4S8LJJ9_DENBC|nr:hypothetical protein K435DRAFT_821512 [Dendrothele bispora CBS 962.96]